jgi:hypothetical protein
MNDSNKNKLTLDPDVPNWVEIHLPNTPIDQYHLLNPFHLIRHLSK